MTLYSAIADCGNGLPRVESIPEAPPRRMLLFWLTPSMKTLMLSWFWAPLCTLTWPWLLTSKRTPGARSAKARKLRVICGSCSICFGLTLVPTSELLRSRPAVPVTTTCSSCVEPAGASGKSRSTVWPMATVSVSTRGAKPPAVMSIL